MKIRLVTWPLVATLAVASACAAPDDTAPGAAAPTATASDQQVDAAAAALLPADIKQAKVVSVASGVSFPPMEYFDTDNKTVLGFDADLGAALGQVLGVEFEFHNTNFDGIVGGLAAHRYDLGLTSMIDKKERQAKVDFVDYLDSGITFLVVKGNPEKLAQQSDLCGHTVAVEKGSTGDLVADDLTAQCVKDGQEKLDKAAFPDQASAVQALQSGRADAVLALDLTLAYNVKQNASAFEVPAKPFGTLPVGIAVPKDDTALRDAVQAALLVVQKNGTYDELLAKWNLSDQALEGAPINTGK